MTPTGTRIIPASTQRLIDQARTWEHATTVDEIRATLRDAGSGYADTHDLATLYAAALGRLAATAAGLAEELEHEYQAAR